MKCPVDPAHGHVIGLAGHPVWGYYCPAQPHDGFRDREPTRAFFTTTEAETGVLLPRDVAELAVPPAPTQRHRRAAKPAQQEVWT